MEEKSKKLFSFNSHFFIFLSKSLKGVLVQFTLHWHTLDMKKTAIENYPSNNSGFQMEISQHMIDAFVALLQIAT